MPRSLGIQTRYVGDRIGVFSPTFTHFSLLSDDVLSAKKFYEILAQAWATVSGMMSGQQNPALITLNNKCEIRFQFSDTHGASSASLGSPTGTGRTDCALETMIVSVVFAEH